MLIFAKNISERDHRHALEDRNPAVKAYMEYQRKLFPYTIVRAGLDLAYKELDDILEYIENDHQPPEHSQRKDYPADIPGWYNSRFPWSAAFLKMEDMHFVLVTLIKAMDSFRTEETINSWHLAVLYDAVHNIVKVYNSLLKDSPQRARDIHLSNNVPVNFDDFINNYWPHLDFMILSKPDYPHETHMARNRKIEDAIRERLADGVDPLEALESVGKSCRLDESTLTMLRRDPPPTGQLEPESSIQCDTTYDWLYQPIPDGKKNAGLLVIDGSYLENFEVVRKFEGSPHTESA